MTLSKCVWMYEVDKTEDVSRKGHHFRGGMGKSEWDSGVKKVCTSEGQGGSEALAVFAQDHWTSWQPF